ncbi:MAG: class II aldolase/adducin family protein [Steroidobacteraceae bacterium]
MSVSKVARIQTIRERVSELEWQIRVDLAAAYRLTAIYGMTDLIYNHITARIPGREDELLINPYGYLYEEITASSLVKIDIEGNILLQPDHGFGINPAGYVIHSAVHSARVDIGCVMHTHTRAGMAVSAMRCGLLPLTQTSLRFYERIGYHDFEGPALDLEERARLVADLGRHDAMILRSHGLLVCGRTVADTFNRMYFLEGACRLQVDAVATGAELITPSTEVARLTARIMSPQGNPSSDKHRSDPMDGQLEWRALLRKLDRTDPSYAS